MTTLVTARAASTAPASAFFDRWADMASWPQWSFDLDWVRLDGPFATGSTGRLKPKGGPAVRFVIERLVPGREFVDVSRLLGARLVFDHQVAPTADGGCTVEIVVTITGPLRRLWTAILGKGVVESTQPDLDRLVATAEQFTRSAG
jgi:hypothetical protein